MWDLIPPSPAQRHCQALVSKAGYWARWPRGRLLSGLTCSGGVSPAGPLSVRCWVSSRFPALALPHCCWVTPAVRCSQEPSSARSGTEITMPRAEAALQRGGDLQLLRSAASQQGGGVHVRADPRQLCAPLRGDQAPAAESRLQLDRQQPPRELRPSKPSRPLLREPSALGELRGLTGCASGARDPVTDGKLRWRLGKRAGDPERLSWKSGPYSLQQFTIPTVSIESRWLLIKSRAMI